MKSIKHQIVVLQIKWLIRKGDIELAINKLINLKFKQEEKNLIKNRIAAEYYTLKNAIKTNDLPASQAIEEQKRIEKLILSLINSFNINITTVFFFILVISCIIFIAYKYYESEQKQKLELAIKEYSKFKNTPGNQIIMQLLDYNGRHLNLYPETPSNPKIYIRDDLLIQALSIHTFENAEFTETEIRIRDLFDSFFDDLSIFNKYIKNNLMEHKDIQNLKYWINILFCLKNNQKSTELKNVFRSYVTNYNFAEVKQLSNEFNCIID